MRKRWNSDQANKDDNWKHRYILQHYFIQRRESRALLRNGIARLWWYGHLTHDANRSDPYELTRELLSYLDIAKVLLEVNLGRAVHVRTGFLDFLRLNKARLGSTAGQTRATIRRLAKLLNLRGGVLLLDCLGTDEVQSLLGNELEFVRLAFSSGMRT